jgi:WD40 repeat protein
LGTGEPVIIKHDSPVFSLAVLEDGRLASGGDDGTIKLWTNGGTGEPVVLTHGDRVLSLAAPPSQSTRRRRTPSPSRRPLP